MKRGTGEGTNRHRLSSGYTIVETMIFLVITGALLVAALGFLAGQQTRTQFNQGLREMDSQIRAALSDVESGYFYDRGGFTCTAVAANTLTVSSGGSTTQGTNENCVFMGKVVQFGPSNGTNCSGGTVTECTEYAVHTVVGRRTTTGGVTPSTLQQTIPTPIFTSLRNTTSPDITEYRSTPGALRINRMYEVLQDNTSREIASVGFLYSLRGGSAASGNSGVTIVGVSTSKLGDDKEKTFDSIRALTEANRNPKQIVICFDHGGTINTSSRVGAIVIGGKGRELTTEVIVDARANPPAGSGCNVG